ncbi:MAG: SLBB domain-containing protein [Treponema sp.]
MKFFCKSGIFFTTFIYILSSLALNAQTPIPVKPPANTTQSTFSKIPPAAEEKQKEGDDSKVDTKAKREILADPQVAMSMPNYPVTAGDVYALAFMAGQTPVKYAISVDTSYKIRVANFGVISCAGLTYPQLKMQVEQVVNKNYPLSGVQFSLTAPAVFLVNISGEVKESSEQKAWALSRLSDFIAPLKTKYSSTRDVTVISASGETKVYDLFKASRDGDFSQEPYLHAGDRIIVNRIDRKVLIGGAVERPGEYELLQGENLKTLIEKYAGGLEPLADTSRISLYRITGYKDAGRQFPLTQEAIDSDLELLSYDEIMIPSHSDVSGSITIEGAIQVGIVNSASLAGASKMTVRIHEGADYSSLIRLNASSFSPSSDLEKCYIRRGDMKIPIDVNRILYDASYYNEESAHNGDVLVIPFKQFFVTVSGAVAKPGRFPYIPDRDWEYYVGLAGGIDTEKNSFQVVSIRNADGKKLSKKDLIPPETTIEVKANSAWYKWNKASGGVTAILSIIATTLSIIITSRAL